MIVVDTSALMAIVLDEPQADICISRLATEPDVLISAGTVAEALIVAGRSGFEAKMARVIDQFDFVIETVTPSTARRVAEAYGRWGKGVHPAALNFGDCFAYELAHTNRCALLFVGKEFAQTDIVSAI